MLTGHDEAEAFGERVASWVDGAVDSASRATLTARLCGVLTVAGPLLTVGVGALTPCWTGSQSWTTPRSWPACRPCAVASRP